MLKLGRKTYSFLVLLCLNWSIVDDGTTVYTTRYFYDILFRVSLGRDLHGARKNRTDFRRNDLC